MLESTERLDVILQLNGRELLQNAGKISHEMAMLKSEDELKKYRITEQVTEREQSLQEIENDIQNLKKN